MKHKILAYALATAMLLIGAAPASAGIISTFNGSALADIDAEGGASTTLSITDMGSIMDLNIAMMINNSIAEPGFFEAFVSDMTITLFHDGVLVTLFSSTGGGDFGIMDIIFDDEAANQVDEGDAMTWMGSWQPDGLLSAFDGMDISGDWILSFQDNHFSDEGDELIAWSLIVELPDMSGGTGGGCDGDCGGGGGNNQIPVPSTVLLFGLGMAALGLRRQNNQSRSVAAL
ncbi:hypothetical protein A9Q98_07240 [Thalassotalea sp. 42_200_T64]|nr:hypothetical protein A9Q98_07240 [Thalassotalea sp. 42_200_T64]